MALWDQEGIPHKGWRCIEMIDLGEDLNELDADERKDYYESCEMCNQEGVRYIHVMEHPNYNSQLRVGYKCAEKMEDDYVKPKNRENQLKNKYNRLRNFLKKDWKVNDKGNYSLKYKTHSITIMPSKFNVGEFGIIFKKESSWNHNGKKIKSLHEAKLLAFGLIDDYILVHRNDVTSNMYFY